MNAKECRSQILMVVLMMATLLTSLFLPVRAAAAVSSLDYWSWSNPAINNLPLRSIAYGNGVYVAAGWWGTVLTSRDGVHWKNKSLPVSGEFRALTFGNGIFVVSLSEPSSTAVGIAYTYLLTSAD